MEIQFYKPSNFTTMNSSELISVIEKFDSIIWTERFNEYGDFELYISIYDEQLVNMISTVGSINFLNYMVDIKGLDSTMIIENLKIETDIEKGDYLTITGKSLESILERRIINKQTTVKGSINNCIKKLLNENAINPTDPNRKINGLEFEDSTNSYILNTNMTAQFTGDNLYETIVYICDTFDIGFEIKRKYYKTKNYSDFNKFVFRLKKGKDRSTNQNVNPFVIFSEKYGNIFSSNYLTSISNQKTFARVAGEGEGSERRIKDVYIPNYSNNKNWRLKELYVDARDIQSELDDQTQMSDEDYEAALEQRGYEKLCENLLIDSVEGEFDPDGNFKLGEDYFLGDIVQIEYPITGISKQARISETVLCENSEGTSYIPTFVLL